MNFKNRLSKYTEVQGLSQTTKSRYQMCLNLNIAWVLRFLFFHHNHSTKNLDLYQTHEQPHPKIIWLYLYLEYYYLIEHLKLDLTLDVVIIKFELQDDLHLLFLLVQKVKRLNPLIFDRL